MKRKVNEITLGEEYTDSLHKRKGIATCYAIHLTGCNRVCLEWLDKEGEVKDLWVDITRLVDSDGNPVVKAENAQDGPGGDPPRRGIK